MSSPRKYDLKPSVTPSSNLFWFIKEGIKLDLSEPSELDMYVQQIITRGGTEDIKDLLKSVDSKRLKESLERIKHFIPDEVKGFWEDFINGSHQ